jgi:plasmid stability protein
MAVIAPGIKGGGARALNGAGTPQALDLSQSIFYNPGRGVPRYEDLYTIRRFSRSHTVSIPMTAIKGQVTTTEWSVVPTVDKPTSKHFAACDAVIDFLDGGFSRNPMTFDTLCKEVLNDILVIDAGVLELVPDDDGFLAEIYPRDGATFTKNPDEHGLLPEPGSDVPAYYQVGAQAPFSQDAFGSGLPRMSTISQMDIPLYRAITPIPFSRDQIVWIEENPSTDRQYGWSRVQMAHRLIEILINQDISNLKYFPQNEVPEGILNLPGLSNDNLTRFREYWKDEIVGKPHKLALMNSPDATWIPFRASPKELEFLASQEWYNNLVWMCFGVSANEVGYVQDVNRSTAQEQAEAVWRRTTVPLLELLAGAINRSILPFLEAYWDVAGEVEFVWDPKNPIIERQKRREQESDLRLGLSTPNRILVERGEEPVPWGDMPIALFESLCRTHPEWVAAEIIGIENAPEPLYGGGLLLSSPDPVTKALADIKAAPDDEPEEWKSRIEALHRRVAGVFDDALQALRPAIEEAFPAERSEDGTRPVVDLDAILDQVAIADDLLAVTAEPRADALRHGIDLESRRLEEELEARVGKGLYRVHITKDFDVTQTFAYRLLQQRAARNMRSVEDSIKDLVRNSLSRVVAEGGNVNDAWLALQRDVAGMTDDHARLVARTEIMGAQRYGKQALAEETEHLLKGKTWRSRKIPGRSRPWHSVMDGVTVPVRESWTVPAIGAKGQPKDYPKQCYVVGEDQPFNCMCDQRLALADDLPDTAQELRSVKGLRIEPLTKQAAVLLEHGRPHETLQALLQRLESNMSRNRLSEYLGISKATLYEWLKE